MKKNNFQNIDEEQVLKYLNRDLSKEETHAFEKRMQDDPFLNDAVEGLMNIDNSFNRIEADKRLKIKIDKQLKAHRGRRRNKHKVWLQQSLWIWMLVILGLIILIYTLFFLITSLYQ